MAFGTDESVLFIEVSLIQKLLNTQIWHLGQTKVSVIERCPSEVVKYTNMAFGTDESVLNREVSLI